MSMLTRHEIMGVCKEGMAWTGVKLTRPKKMFLVKESIAESESWIDSCCKIQRNARLDMGARGRADSPYRKS